MRTAPGPGEESAAVAAFGRHLTAMITPFTADGALDVDGAGRLAAYLVDVMGMDGLVVSGTTGESPTTSDAEKDTLLRVVLEAVGDRARVVAGIGTNDTRHTCELARSAERSGAHGLLLVSPYYSRPPQAGLLAHCRAVADGTGLPVMLYDIPVRTGVAFDPDTLVRLAEHPRILANKDAKGDLGAASWVLSRSDLAWYSGDDLLNLPLLSIGAVGFVSVVGHVVGDRLVMMAESFRAGDVAAAARAHLGLMPVFRGMFRTQGVILTKAALALAGLPSGPVRLPLVDADLTQRTQLAQDLRLGGVPVVTGTPA